MGYFLYLFIPKNKKVANIKFRLNKGKEIKDESLPQKIYLRYRLGRDIDFNASLKFTVLKDDWNFDEEKVRNRSHISNKNEINNLINNLKQHFIAFDNKNREQGITPSYTEVKKYFDSYFTTTEENTPITLFSFIDKFIENAKTKPNPITKKLVSYNTIKDYNLTKNTLQNFNDEVYKIDFEKITLDWYYDFIEWCNNKGFKMNYTGKHIKTLKTFLNNAFELGLTTNLTFKSRKFSVYKEETDSIYLNQNELLKFWSLDLSNEPRKEIARDLFLIGAYTGLRVSDYNNLTEQKIKVENGVKILRVKTEKTGRIVAIPIHPIVAEILKKNNGNPPKRIPDQEINVLIKQIAKAKNVELNDKIELNYNRAGKDVTVFKHKHELVTTHTARRSFCTNAYLSGMNPMDIMAISGHTTEKNFRKYVKVSPEQVAIKMSEHTFFKDGSALKIIF